jgi:hypothetical protein
VVFTDIHQENDKGEEANKWSELQTGPDGASE